MKFPMNGALGRHRPLALVFALLLQAANGCVVGLGEGSRQFFLGQRVTNLESDLRTYSRWTGQFERLARIEERQNAQISMIDRIEKNTASLRKQ